MLFTQNYIITEAEDFADKHQLPKVELGGATNCPNGYISADIYNADKIVDLTDKWSFDESSIGFFRAVDVIEHFPDKIHTMNEAFRCLANGGYFSIIVPSTDGRGAWLEPTHCSYWNELSFQPIYLSRDYILKTPYTYLHKLINCNFDILYVNTLFFGEEEEKLNISHVEVHLRASK